MASQDFGAEGQQKHRKDYLLRVRMREQLFISRLIRNSRVGLFGWMDGWMEYMQMRN